MNLVLEVRVSKFLGELNLAEGYTGNALDRISTGGQGGTCHVINGWDITHRCGVTRTRLNLIAIGEGLADTVVDKVIPGQL